MSRPAGIPNRRFATGKRKSIIALLEKTADEWMADTDPEVRREGFKAIAPYFIPRLTTTLLQGDKDNPVVVHFDKEDANL